jgi:hypothetical protein
LAHTLRAGRVGLGGSLPVVQLRLLLLQEPNRDHESGSVLHAARRRWQWTRVVLFSSSTSCHRLIRLIIA